MTLLKPRDPMTIAGAAARVIELVGAEVAGAHLGLKNGQMVYKWSNPDTEFVPSFAQAIAMDNLCAPHGEMPFMDYYQHRLAPRTDNGGCMLSATRKAGKTLAELTDHLHEAMEDGVFTENERLTACQLLSLLERKVRVVKNGCSAEGA